MKNKTRVLIQLISILSILLTSCSKATPSPTSAAVDLVQTEIAMQVSAGLTQTAAVAQPTNTESALPPTEPPKQAPPTLGIATLEGGATSLTPAEQPTDALAPQPTSQANCTYRADLYYDSIEDGKLIEEKKIFKRIWDLRNVGTCTWPPGTYLRFVGGDLMGADSVQEFVETSILPGERVRVETLLQSPNLEKGVRLLPMQGNWMIATTDGHLFGLGADGKGHLWTSVVICVYGRCK